MLTPEQAVDRLTLGATPGLVNRLNDLGVAAWIERQLTPGNEPASLKQRLATLPGLNLGPATLFERYGPRPGMRGDPVARKQYQMGRRDLYREAVSARLLNGSLSPWQLRELLVDFWFNHFNVFAHKGLCALWTGAYEQQAIRPHVLGRFEDLLLATARHPAMLFYLDNWRNAVPRADGNNQHAAGFNENYAREVMELHTVGLHYTQADVIGAMHLLTGWGLDRDKNFRFAPRRHDFSSQTILGQRFSGGEDAGVDFLRFLARHPDTARHVSFEMAQYFVADVPPTDLVAHMSARFRNSRGDLKAVTAAMIEHPAFAAAAARRDKFRTPYRYLLALLRASGRVPDRPQPLIGMLNQLGQPLYGCVQPNGWSCTQADWLSADALTTRLNLAVALGGGWLVVDDNAPRGAAVPPAPVWKLIAAAAGSGEPTLRGAMDAVPERLKAAVLLGSPQMQYC